MIFWHLNMTLLRGQTRALWDRHLGSSLFFRLVLRLKVFRSIAFKYVHDYNTQYSDAARFKGSSIFVWVLFQDISDLIRLLRTVQRTYFINYDFCFTCFKVEYKRSYIFSKFFQWNNNLYLDMNFHSEVPINCGFRSLKGSLFFSFWKLYRLSSSCKQAFILSLTKFNRPSKFRGKKNMNQVNNMIRACCLRVVTVIEMYFI